MTDQIPDTPEIFETKRTLHGNASLVMLALQQVLRATGAVEDPQKLAALEAALEAGTVGLACYLQLDGGTLFLSATAVPGGKIQDPLGEGGIKMSGPLITSVDLLAALHAQVPGKMN